MANPDSRNETAPNCCDNGDGRIFETQVVQVMGQHERKLPAEQMLRTHSDEPDRRQSSCQIMNGFNEFALFPGSPLKRHL